MNESFLAIDPIYALDTYFLEINDIIVLCFLLMKQGFHGVEFYPVITVNEEDEITTNLVKQAVTGGSYAAIGLAIDFYTLVLACQFLHDRQR